MIFQAYGKYELAEVSYGRAAGLAPGSFRWLYYLGNVEGWLGRHREAIGHIQEALKRDANYTPARVRLGDLFFESVLLEPGAKAYDEALRQNPKLASAYLRLGRVHTARAGSGWRRPGAQGHPGDPSQFGVAGATDRLDRHGMPARHAGT